jgi:hypothetical protein
VTRAFSFILILVALAASGIALKQHWGHISLLPRTKDADAAVVELQAAARSLAQTHAQLGTYSETDLSHFNGLTIAYARERDYCIQVVRGQLAWHLAGPEGQAGDGICPPR